MNVPYAEVLFEEMNGIGGHLGVITLNRVSALNSLNQAMVLAMHAQLKEWEKADHIKAVVIRSAEGRAFCAGGDLRMAYEGMKNNDPDVTSFFREEYKLNQLIFHYPKPYIALLNGITMGGGVGISIHGSHRIATDKLLFAMPETGIGFFPDVGGTWFLPRLPKRMGYYLGLTGARIKADDCVAVGIATHKISEESLEHIIHALARTSFTNNARESVSKIMEPFCIAVTDSNLMQHAGVIEKCFADNTMENIIAALKNNETEFCKEMIETLAKKSPTSLKVTLRAIEKGGQLDFDECMQQEYKLVSHFVKGHDFREGIRAVIIDKDQKPRWQPSTLEGVSEEMVKAYFENLVKSVQT